jgi:hypothetical protein
MRRERLAWCLSPVLAAPPAIEHDPGPRFLADGSKASPDLTRLSISAESHVSNLWKPKTIVARTRIPDSFGRLWRKAGSFPARHGRQRIVLPLGAKLEGRFELQLLGGVTTITSQGFQISAAGWEHQLYRPLSPAQPQPVAIKAIPYFAWGNRQLGKFVVWVPSVR